MKQILDFLPILLFFIAYKLGDIYSATAVLMAATVVQTGILYIIDRKLQLMQKVMLGMILLFGTLTLVLHDDRFIKWKPTVFYAGTAIVLAIALWVYKTNYLKILLEKQIALPEKVWSRLALIWMVYFLFMAAINAYAAIAFSTDAYVSFKLWGYAIPLSFILLQGLYIAKHLLPDSDNPLENKTPNASNDRNDSNGEVNPTHRNLEKNSTK